jgi:16S rRNA pseudouridine516 synthase
MRLDKYIASVTDYSRREVKIILKDGLVTVGGIVQVDPGFSVDASTAVELDGEQLRASGFRYFMLNKPEGYVCANKDRQHLTVLQLLDEDNLQQLHVAGRLDIDTTGLVLLSDDGQWTHRITSPRKECRKTYYLETAEPIEDSYIERFVEGIKLDGEKRKTLPAELTILDEQSARLIISEGKYHQVKRMFSAMGNKVDCLRREQIGSIVLDEDLLPGEYRPLAQEEINSL